MLVDKLPDLANVAVGASLFGQLIGEQHFSLPVAGGGIALWAFLMFVAFFFGRNRQ